ncbi:hypothetical protein JL721_9351 [Aureococcus anophagefferens]|nr:hypothetical protein JL721_9351 [Aureococcus anophagefferens]
MGRAAALVVLAWLRCACAQIPEGIGFDDDDFFRPTQKPVQVNTYQQGAEHEWDDPHDDDYSDDGATIRTQCYTGSDLYQTEKTFCDLECLDSYKGSAPRVALPGRDGAIDDVDCSGPWYCSKMEICQMYHQKNTNDQEQGFQRGCMTVRSCANHSQCFPTAQDQRNMNIQWYDGWDGTMADLGSRIRDHGFKMFYGGMTFETACVNRPTAGRASTRPATPRRRRRSAAPRVRRPRRRRRPPRHLRALRNHCGSRRLWCLPRRRGFAFGGFGGEWASTPVGDASPRAAATRRGTAALSSWTSSTTVRRSRTSERRRAPSGAEMRGRGTVPAAQRCVARSRRDMKAPHAGHAAS